MIELEEGSIKGETFFIVSVASNKKVIGEFMMEVDGYFVFYMEPYATGFWTEQMLRAIADELKRVNASWDATVRANV